jgi:hypothetical protein
MDAIAGLFLIVFIVRVFLYLSKNKDENLNKESIVNSQIEKVNLTKSINSMPERIDVDKFKQGIKRYEEKYDLEISEDHRQILICLASLQSIGKLQKAFLGNELNGDGNRHVDFAYNSPFVLMRYDLDYDDKYDNPFFLAEEGQDYTRHKGLFPVARGNYGDGYDFIYFAQRDDGKLERLASVMREYSKIGFLAVNLKPLVRGALLLKDLEAAEQTLGYTINPIFYADDLKCSKIKEVENLEKKLPSANKRILDYYRKISVGFQYPALYEEENIWNKTKPMGKPDMSENDIAEIGADFKHAQQINLAEFDETKDSLFPAKGLMNIFLHIDVVKREDAHRLKNESFKLHFQANPVEGKRGNGDTIYLLQSKSLYPSFESKLWEQEEISFSQEEKDYVYKTNTSVLTDKLKQETAFFFGGIPPLRDSSGINWSAAQMWGEEKDKEEDFLHISSFLLPDNVRNLLWRVCVGIKKIDLIETKFEKVKVFVFKVY